MLYQKGDKYPFFGVAIIDLLVSLVCVVLILTGYVDAPYDKPEKPRDGPLFEQVDETGAAEKAEEEAYENIRMCSTPLQSPAIRRR